jgi:hypothetical protein
VSRPRAAAALIALFLAGCKGDADFSAAAPAPVTLSAEEYREAITDVDRLVFGAGAVDGARRGALSRALEAMAGRVKATSDSRFLLLESLELRRLAAAAKRLPSEALPASYANEWMRIRSNLFDDRSWFARSAADLESSPTTTAAGVTADAAPAIARLTAELDARGPRYPMLTRVVAIGEELLPYGAAARPAVPLLANGLRYYSLFAAEQDREALLQRLGKIVATLDPDAAYYGERRFQYGADKSSQDRGRTVAFLLYRPLPRERAVPVLRAAMGDPDDWIRDISAAGLVRFGETVPPDPRPFTERVLSASGRVNEEAFAEMRSLDAAARARRIRSLLASGNTRDAYAAGVLYDRLEDPVVQAAILDSIEDPASRRSALLTFGYELPLPADRVPTMIAAMGDERADVRDEARRVLLRKGPTHRVLVPILIAAMANGSAALSESAAAALKEVTGRDFGTDAEKWRRWREAKLEGEPPQILLPGPHHGEEVPLNAEGAWWAICGAEGRRELKQVIVAVKLVRDPVLDDDSRTTGAEVDVRGCENLLALMRNVPGLRDRALRDGTISPVRKGVSTLRFGKTALEIRSVPVGEKGARLELASDGRRQTLFSAEAGFPAGRESWKVAWIGDLDGDGRADLLLDATEDENVGHTFLLLSGPAEPGTLLKLVATFRTVGC